MLILEINLNFLSLSLSSNTYMVTWIESTKWKDSNHAKSSATASDTSAVFAPHSVVAAAATWGCGCWRRVSGQFFLSFHDWILKLGLLVDVAAQWDKDIEWAIIKISITWLSRLNKFFVKRFLIHFFFWQINDTQSTNVRSCAERAQPQNYKSVKW